MVPYRGSSRIAGNEFQPPRCRTSHIYKDRQLLQMTTLRARIPPSTAGYAHTFGRRHSQELGSLRPFRNRQDPRLVNLRSIRNDLKAGDLGISGIDHEQVHARLLLLRESHEQWGTTTSSASALPPGSSPPYAPYAPCHWNAPEITGTSTASTTAPHAT